MYVKSYPDNRSWAVQKTVNSPEPLEEKHPDYATKYEAVDFHHDDAGLDVADPVKNYWGHREGEVLHTYTT